MKKSLLTLRASFAENRGFTLLLAALVAAIVLSLASSIFTVAQKQLVLSSIGRDSQFAFYAADTAAECALYWDLRPGGPGFPSEDGGEVPGVTCDGVPAENVDIDVQGQRVTTSFDLNLFAQSDHSPLGYCVRVSVQRQEANPTTLIHADGYNVDCAQRDTSPRALQRSVELKY